MEARDGSQDICKNTESKSSLCVHTAKHIRGAQSRTGRTFHRRIGSRLDVKRKSKEYLPLSRVTGDPLEDLKQIFPEIFDGQVVPFERKVAAMFTKPHLERMFGIVSGMVSFSPHWMPGTEQLDEQSQLLNALNTPLKKACFMRLTFRLSTCIDDVRVPESTEEHHDIHLY